jgi:hypothetical protein
MASAQAYPTLPQDTTVDLDRPDAPRTPELAGVSEWIGPPRTIEIAVNRP